MRGGNHMDNQLPELKVNMLGRFSITYGEQPITFKRNSATKAVKLLRGRTGEGDQKIVESKKSVMLCVDKEEITD